MRLPVATGETLCYAGRDSRNDLGHDGQVRISGHACRPRLVAPPHLCPLTRVQAQFQPDVAVCCSKCLYHSFQSRRCVLDKPFINVLPNRAAKSPLHLTTPTGRLLVTGCNRVATPRPVASVPLTMQHIGTHERVAVVSRRLDIANTPGTPRVLAQIAESATGSSASTKSMCANTSGVRPATAARRRNGSRI